MALLTELEPLSDVQCTACDGWGHTAGKKGMLCPTASRLYAMKGSKVMGKMVTLCMQSVKDSLVEMDVGTAARRAWLKPNAEDLGKVGAKRNFVQIEQPKA